VELVGWLNVDMQACIHTCESERMNEGTLSFRYIYKQQV
jgi:hypothetical protein